MAIILLAEVMENEVMSSVASHLQEVEAQSKKAAFLSTPSIYFSLKDKNLRSASRVFDVSPCHKYVRRCVLTLKHARSHSCNPRATAA